MFSPRRYIFLLLFTKKNGEKNRVEISSDTFLSYTTIIILKPSNFWGTQHNLWGKERYGFTFASLWFKHHSGLFYVIVQSSVF